MRSAVLVDKVEWVSRELNTTAGFALDEEGVVGSCDYQNESGETAGSYDIRTISQTRSSETF